MSKLVKEIDFRNFDTSDNIFVFVSYWNTLLSIGVDSAELCQSQVIDAVPNLLFRKTSKGFSIEPRLSSGFDALQRLEPSCRSWKYEWREAQGKVTIRTGSGFVCAEPEGKILLSRDEAQAWEEFIPIPLRDFTEYQRRLHAVRGRSVTACPKLTRSQKIEKVVHQTYPNEAIPLALEYHIRRFREKNPDYDYQFYTDERIHDFIKDEYGYYMLEKYLRINPQYGAARADFFRYLCLYKIGGVYLDIKSGCRKPLSELILPDDEYILSQWDNGVGRPRDGFGLHPELSHIAGGEYQQWHIICAAGHPFLEAVINSVLRNIENYDEIEHVNYQVKTLQVTGPIAYTLAISPLLQSCRHRFIRAEEEGLIYSMVGKHHDIFKKHYTKLLTPIIL